MSEALRLFLVEDEDDIALRDLLARAAEDFPDPAGHRSGEASGGVAAGTPADGRSTKLQDLAGAPDKDTLPVSRGTDPKYPPSDEEGFEPSSAP